MVIRKIIGSVVFVFLLTVLAGCGGGGSTPVIETPNADKSVITGNTEVFEISPVDGATYSWTCSMGDFTTATDGPTVTWLAPQWTEPQTVTVVVDDGVNEPTSLTWTVDVVPWVINQNILAPTTWDGNRVYLIETPSTLGVWDTLTIEEGCIVKFNCNGDRDIRGIYVEPSGAIVAGGSADKRIIFTSYKDDNHGGDTNKDGSTPASRSDWNMIELNEEAGGSSFNYCDFLWAGYQELGALLVFQETFITNCTFAHIDANGPAAALDASQAAQCVISDNTFTDTTYPLTINITHNIGDSNTFSDNDYNAIWLWDSNIPEAVNVRWDETEVAFMYAHPWTLSIIGSLTLGNSVVLKMAEGITIDATEGTFAFGTDSYVTALNDDYWKGDSNGDGDATEPWDSYWVGVVDYPYDYRIDPAIYYDENSRNTHDDV